MAADGHVPVIVTLAVIVAAGIWWPRRRKRSRGTSGSEADNTAAETMLLAATAGSPGRDSKWNLKRKGLDDVRCESLGRVMIAYSSRLEVLELSHNQIGDRGVAALVGALTMEDAPLLRVLWLDENKIGPAGARAIRDWLKNHTKLATLGLSQNQLGDQGARYISEALGESANQTLTELRLKVRLPPSKLAASSAENHPCVPPASSTDN